MNFSFLNGSSAIVYVGAVALALAGFAYMQQVEIDAAQAKLDTAKEAAKGKDARITALEAARKQDAANLTETERRLSAQKAINDATQRQVDAARSDASDASAAADRLRKRIAAADARAKQTAADSAKAGACPAAAAADLPADVSSRLIEAVRQLASFADDLAIDADSCHAQYDSLNTTPR